MLEANGGDFPNDPKLCPMIGSAPTYAARHSSRRVPTIGRSRCRLVWRFADAGPMTVAPRTGAGVRKPPMEETAGRDTLGGAAWVIENW